MVQATDPFCCVVRIDERHALELKFVKLAVFILFS